MSAVLITQVLSSTDGETVRRAWEYHRTLDELLAHRMSYGMVAHSMLLVTYATLVVADHRGRSWLTFVEIVVASLGIWYSAVQNSSINAIIHKLRFLTTRYLEPLDPIYAAMRQIAPSTNRKLRQRLVPIALGYVWAALLVVCAIWPAAR
jgi:hypothetical protein